MASGVSVSDDCKKVYQQVKMNMTGQKKLRYVVLKISDNRKEIIVDEDRMQTAESTDMCEPEHFMDVISKLPTDDGRYIVYDYPYQGSFGMSSKIIMIMWCPSSVCVKQRMLYASSKDGLKKSFPDCGGELFQADCPDDLCHEDIEAKLRKV